MSQSMVDRLQADFDRVVGDVQRYLASEQGTRLRHQAASAIITAAPVLAMAAGKRLPFVGKLIGAAGLTATVITLAEKMREWEPAGAER